MEVDPKDWPILSGLMDEWLDLTEERRAEWMAGVESRHPRLVPALRELLAQPRPGFLESLPAIEDTDDGHATSIGVLAAGMPAGPYRLERELGRGGMGVVWLAARADASLKRNVALKFPLFPLHDPTFAKRFERERDILARLEDARIARLYDAGVTSHGQPYLALEYVEGEPITMYCDRLALDIRARLKLFVEVLRGVQYAHTNLVVHRDLKPSNIMVTNEGQVRLLDFGIAKLLEEGEAAETEITRSGGRALTPGYASPEQIAGRAITTATDVYSLGVLLYELVTGSRPQPGRGVSGEAEEQHLSADPVRPSQAASDEAKAKLRGGMTPKGLASTLRGDLDTMILKAIQREPQDRYPTADAFAQDIDRFLSGQPVLARPVSAWYRTRKFVLRNKLAVSAAVTAVLALAGGAGIAMWQKRRADVEAATARAVTDFLQHDLLSQAGSLSQSGPGQRADPDIKIRTALDRASERVGGRFAAQPAVEAAIRQTIGGTYWELGLYAQAERQLTRAVELRKQVLGPAHPDTLASIETLAETYDSEGKYAAAETLLNSLIETERGRRREDSLEAIKARHTLASIAVDGHADLARAEALYTPLIEAERRVLGEANPTTLATMNNLAAVYSREAKYAQAEDLYRRLIEAKRRVLGPDHPSTLSSMNGLGVLYRNQGKYKEAEPVFQQVLEARRRVMGDDHRDTAASMNGLGLLYSIEGRYGEAEPLLTQSVEISSRVLGKDNPDTQSSLNNLAELYRREENWKQSEARYQQLLQARLRTYGPDNPFTANTQGGLGEVRLQLGRFAEAAGLLKAADDFYRKHGIQTWRRYYVECLWGASLAAQGRRAEAKPLITAGYDQLIKRKDTIPPESRRILDEARRLTTK